jgi:hypothetical protein
MEYDEVWEYTHVASSFPISHRGSLLCGAEQALRYQDLQTQLQAQNSAFLLRHGLTYFFLSIVWRALSVTTPHRTRAHFLNLCLS